MKSASAIHIYKLYAQFEVLKIIDGGQKVIYFISGLTVNIESLDRWYFRYRVYDIPSIPWT